MSVKNGVGAAALMQPGLVSTTTQLYLCLYLYFLFTVFYLLAFLFVFGTFGRSNAARSGEHHHATVRLYLYFDVFHSLAFVFVFAFCCISFVAFVFGTMGQL